MQTHARAVVIGGGAVGCGILYHLAKAGWDTLLLERDDLTAGSTWHAAGLLPLFNMSYAVSHIHQRSIELYERLEAETGLNAGFSRVGNLRMAQTAERMDEYRLYAATADTVGVNYEWLTNKDIKDRYPLVHTDDLKGAILHPDDGYINPADVTMAMAKGARMAGAKIERKKQVDAITKLPSGEWHIAGHDLKTKEPFEVTCEVVVTATGNHAQRTAAMVGCYIPAMPVEHQFVVTGESPTLKAWREAGNPEHPVLRDADAKWYVREERGGWILGPYERNAPAWAKWGVPENFFADLLEPDLDRIEEELISGMHRIPCFEEGGLKTTYNGPICYTPDGNPLVGPAPGVDNFYFAEGFSFGITAAGGTGHYLSQLITEGEAEIDMWSLDPRRFGRWMNREYAATKNEEAYEHVYILHHPDEERDACRPLKTAPSYDRFKALGAQFGCVNGWERPNYFADTPDFDDHASRSFRHSGWRDFAIAEAEATRSSLALYDASAFTKHVLKGPGAEQFLDWLTCNKLPKQGRINLTYALSTAGTVRTEFTIVRTGEDSFYLVSAGAAEGYDSDYLHKMVKSKTDEFGAMALTNVTSQTGVFVIAGPNSRALMERLISAPDPKQALTNKAFPWLSMRQVDLGMVPTSAIRVSYVGELGWELHHPMEMQNHLFDKIMEASAGLGPDGGRIKPCGSRAMNWLRQEKSYRAFGSDLGRDATPLEGGLDRFVDLSKDFKGKAAMEATGIRSKCVTVLIDGPDDADPWGREVLFDDKGVRAGRLTSGGWSVSQGKAIGIGYVKPELAVSGTNLTVKIMDKLYPAIVVDESPYDPKNEVMRVNSDAAA